MGNSRVKDRYALALEGKQVLALAIGVTVLVAGVFVLGLNLGRRSVIAAAVITAPRDPLARLDEPLPVRDEAVELKAHQALTDARPIDKSLPVPQVKATTVSIVPHAAQTSEPVVATAESKVVKADPVRTERSAEGAESKAAKIPSVRPERSAATAEPKVAKAAPVRTERSVEGAKSKSAKKGAYAIQIASLSKRSEAERVAKKNGSRSPRIVEANVPGKGRYYRVLVGSFDTQDAAKRQLASLTRAGLKGIVTPVR